MDKNNNKYYFIDGGTKDNNLFILCLDNMDEIYIHKTRTGSNYKNYKPNTKTLKERKGKNVRFQHDELEEKVDGEYGWVRKDYIVYYKDYCLFKFKFDKKTYYYCEITPDHEGWGGLQTSLSYLKFKLEGKDEELKINRFIV